MSNEIASALVSHVEIENFKAVERTSLDLKPLTVVVGVNSSGKSTFIQAMLLLVQHIRDQYSVDTQYSLNEKDLVELGSFDEVVLNTPLKNAETFRVEIRVNPRIARRVPGGDKVTQTVTWAAELKANDSKYSRFAQVESMTVKIESVSGLDSSTKEKKFELIIESLIDLDSEAYEELKNIPIVGDRSSIRIVNGRKFSSMGSVALRYLGFPNGQLPTEYQRLRLSEALARESRRAMSFSDTFRETVTGLVSRQGSKTLASKLINQAKSSRDASLLDDFRKRLSSEMNAKIREIAEIEEWKSITDIDEMGNQKHPFSSMDDTCNMVYGLLRSVIGKVINEFDYLNLADSYDKMTVAVTEVARELLGNSDFVLLAPAYEEDFPGQLVSRDRGGLRSALSGVHYLGPIRDIDREFSGSFPRRSLGVRGEYCATVLQRESRERIKFPPLPSGVDVSDGPIRFSEVLNLWMQYLHLATAVEVEDRGRQKAGIKIIPRRGGEKTVSVNSVGVGVAQVLPIVMQCLLAEPGSSITIIEQPELHLHPSIEVKLADFFLACAKTGRQIFIETHSEHLINRLRLEIASDSSGETRQLVSVLFANQDEETGITSYENAIINDLGGIEGGWPDKFLDLSTEQSLELLETAVRRRRSDQYADFDDEDEDF